MKYRIRYLSESLTDREAIKSYLSQYYNSTVTKFFKLLKKKIDRLKRFPYSCPVYDDDPDYRVLIVGNYLVFFMINEDEEIVEIHRIFHGAQDIGKHLISPETD